MKRLFPSLPAPAHLGHVFQAFPDRIAPLMQLNETWLRSEGELTIGERELIAAYVSGLNACGFCHGVHSTIAESFGVDAGLIDALMADPESAPIEPKLRPLLAYAEKLTRTPAMMTEADAEAVYSAGWSEAALFEAVQVTALFNLMNRIVEGTGVVANAPSPAPLPEGASPRDHGYLDFGRRIGVID